MYYIIFTNTKEIMGPYTFKHALRIKESFREEDNQKSVIVKIIVDENGVEI